MDKKKYYYPDYSGEYYQKNKKRLQAYQKKHYEEHRDLINQRKRELYQSNEVYRKDRLTRSRLRYANLPPEARERGREQKRAEKRRLKIEVLTHYGNGKFACVICGENRFPCLSVDHIGGDGANHRTSLGWGKAGGTRIYRWLRDNDYPDGYQTLCMNCQWAKRYENKEYSKGSNQYIKREGEFIFY